MDEAKTLSLRVERKTREDEIAEDGKYDRLGKVNKRMERKFPDCIEKGSHFAKTFVGFYGFSLRKLHSKLTWIRTPFSNISCLD